MRMRGLSILALLATLSMAMPATAQLAPSRSGYSSTSVSNSEKLFLENLWVYGTCFAGGLPDETRALLATTRGSPEEAAVYARIDNMKINCIGQEMNISVPVWMLRGALAEGAYRKMVKRAVPPVVAPDAPDTPPATTLTGGTHCYVAAHAAQAHALIFDTRPGSSKEVQAVNALLPDFVHCVSPGIPVNLPAVQLRYGLAEALYHAVLPATQGTK